MKNSTLAAIKTQNIILTSQQERIIKELDNIQNGAYFRISYIRDCEKDVRAGMKSAYNVQKCTEMSVRKGVLYSNTKAGKESIAKVKASGTAPRDPWYRYIDKTIIQHKTSGKLYLVVYPNVSGRPHSHYMVNGRFMDSHKLEQTGVMIPSYWSRHDNKPIMMTIELDKIISVF